MSERVDVKRVQPAGLGVATLIYAPSGSTWIEPVRILLLGVAVVKRLADGDVRFYHRRLHRFWLLGGSLPVLNWRSRFAIFRRTNHGIHRSFPSSLYFPDPDRIRAFYPSQLFLPSGSAPLLAYLSPFVGSDFPTGVFYLSKASMRMRNGS